MKFQYDKQVLSICNLIPKPPRLYILRWVVLSRKRTVVIRIWSLIFAYFNFLLIGMCDFHCQINTRFVAVISSGGFTSKLNGLCWQKTVTRVTAFRRRLSIFYLYDLSWNPWEFQVESASPLGRYGTSMLYSNSNFPT